MKSAAFRIQILENLGDMRAVDVGHEMETHADRVIGGQRFDGHGRAQIRAADADIDDVGDRIGPCAFPIARTDESR